MAADDVTLGPPVTMPTGVTLRVDQCAGWQEADGTKYVSITVHLVDGTGALVRRPYTHQMNVAAWTAAEKLKIKDFRDLCLSKAQAENPTEFPS